MFGPLKLWLPVWYFCLCKHNDPGSGTIIKLCTSKSGFHLQMGFFFIKKLPWFSFVYSLQNCSKSRPHESARSTSLRNDKCFTSDFQMPIDEKNIERGETSCASFSLPLSPSVTRKRRHLGKKQ